MSILAQQIGALIPDGHGVEGIPEMPISRQYLMGLAKPPPPKTLSECRTGIMVALDRTPGLTLAGLNRALPFSRPTIAHHLDILVGHGRVRAVVVKLGGKRLTGYEVASA